MAEIKVGDVVQLQHDSSLEMTVEEVNDDGTYTCIWHGGDGTLQREKLKKEVLYFPGENYGSSQPFFS